MVCTVHYFWKCSKEEAFLREHRGEIDKRAGNELIRIEARRRAKEQYESKEREREWERVEARIKRERHVNGHSARGSFSEEERYREETSW